LEALKTSRIVAVGGGNEKIRAIGSILRSGLLDGLVTDERTAKALIN
jgi:DNA-binding transcriptional regulator LsrR (DeoR family)